jgi:hypothetical protein
MALVGHTKIKQQQIDVIALKIFDFKETLNNELQFTQEIISNRKIIFFKCNCDTRSGRLSHHSK